MSITRILSLVIVFGIALFAGFKIGRQINPIIESRQHSLDVTAMPDIPFPGNDQFNILIIGVNDLDKASVELQSIWLLAYSQASPQVTLVPVFPSPDNSQQDQLLASAFSLQHGKPSKEFWDLMRERDLWWKGYLIGDMISAMKLINVLGGIEVDGKLTNGVEMVSSIPSWEENAVVAIKRQKDLLEGICHRLTKAKTVDLETFNEIFSQQPQVNIEATLFIKDWTTIAAVYENLTCKFPTFTNTPPQSQISTSAH